MCACEHLQCMSVGACSHLGGFQLCSPDDLCQSGGSTLQEKSAHPLHQLPEALLQQQACHLHLLTWHLDRRLLPYTFRIPSVAKYIRNVRILSIQYAAKMLRSLLWSAGFLSRCKHTHVLLPSPPSSAWRREVTQPLNATGFLSRCVEIMATMKPATKPAVRMHKESWKT